MVAEASGTRARVKKLWSSYSQAGEAQTLGGDRQRSERLWALSSPSPLPAPPGWRVKQMAFTSTHCGLRGRPGSFQTCMLVA